MNEKKNGNTASVVVESPFLEMMRRVARAQKEVENGTMQPSTANTIFSGFRSWVSGAKCAMQAEKMGSLSARALMEGTPQSK